MVRFPEAEARLFHRVFVCRKCHAKIRAPVLKVSEKRVKCRKCGSRDLRPIRRK